MQLGSVMHVVCICESSRDNEVTGTVKCVFYLLLGFPEIYDLEVKYFCANLHFQILHLRWLSITGCSGIKMCTFKKQLFL